MYKVCSEESGVKSLFAMKKFFSNSTDDDENGIPYSALREIACMKKLRTFPNRFIVKIVDVIMHNNC